MNPTQLPRRLFAEFLGSAFLAATVVGSGIAAAQRRIEELEPSQARCGGDPPG